MPKIYILKKGQNPSTNGFGKIVSHPQEYQPGPVLSACVILSSKWLKDLSIRPGNPKIAIEKGGSTVQLLGSGKSFQNGLAAQEIRPTLDKCGLKNFKGFCTTKETVKWANRQPTEWRKSLPAIHLTEDCSLEYRKNQKKF